jgi:hypothetical protein
MAESQANAPNASNGERLHNKTNKQMSLHIVPLIIDIGFALISSKHTTREHISTNILPNQCLSEQKFCKW